MNPETIKVWGGAFLRIKFESSIKQDGDSANSCGKQSGGGSVS